MNKEEIPEVKELRDIAYLDFMNITREGPPHELQGVAFKSGFNAGYKLSEQKDKEIAELNKIIETYISLVDDTAKEILEKDKEITELKAEISGLDDNLLLLE